MGNELICERRLGARNQFELNTPIGTMMANSGKNGQVFAHLANAAVGKKTALDELKYRLAVRDPAAVVVELQYQPIGYRWAQNLGAYDAAEPRRFVGYYNSMARFSSVTVARVSRRIER